MISYRTAPQLRVERSGEPMPPFFAATTIYPYAGRREGPVSIDFASLTASATERSEVRVVGDPADLLAREERSAPLRAPVLIEATGYAEVVYRRGESSARFCVDQDLPCMALVSTGGDVPRFSSDLLSVAIAAWPMDLEVLESIFGRAEARGHAWGVLIPVVFPVSTELAVLGRVADAAARRGATFLSAFSPEVDASARSVLARLDAADDEESYHELFEGRLDTISVASERHVAALAASHGMRDWMALPSSGQTNWNAAAMLARCADRIMRGRDDAELAWEILRSARTVAELPKPIARIAESASLSIVEGLDEISLDMLEQWVREGNADFADRVDGEWRLRRDHGV